MARYDLSDEEWTIIEPLLPRRGKGKRRVDDRRVVNGIFYVLRTGAPWRDLPERYGPYTTVYNRFNRWAKRGIWLKVFEELSRRSPPLLAFDRQLHRPRPPARRRRKKGGEDHAIGRSRGGLSTKIHAVVDQDGLPVKLMITPGQASDKTVAPHLLDTLPAGTVVADRGYDSKALVERVRDRGGIAHIPTQSRVRVQRSVPADLYRQRNLVERFFCNLKQFRRIATRFEKHAVTFMAAIALAASRIWIRAIESAP